MRRNAVAWAALVISTAALAGNRFAAKPATAVQEIPAEGQKAARALSEAFGAVADFARPSVVQISVEKKMGGLRLPGLGGRGNGNSQDVDPKDMEEMLKKFFGPGSGFKFEKEQFAAQGTGSGFVYDDRGHILTNNHVVSGAGKIKVTFHDGETAEAKVVGTDPGADVAVIQVDTNRYRSLPKGNSDKLRVGEWVIAVGSPFGLEQTVTAGIISATERGTVGINQYESFLQTDCAINPGNSGGPLIDMNGRVVGINSAIATTTRASAGVGFAIPIDMASVLADKLIKDGKVSRVMVGIRMSDQPFTPSLAKKLGLSQKTQGVLVDKVLEGTPSAKAGVKPGDVITEFNGHPVHSMATFRNLVSASDAGKSYPLKLFRDGREQVVQVTPAPEGSAVFAQGRPAQLNDFGLAVQPLNAELAAKYKYPKDATGLVVTEVASESPAELAGLEKGDLITDVVQGKKIVPVKTADELASAAQGRDRLSLYVRNVREPEKDAEIITLNPKGEEKQKQ